MKKTNMGWLVIALGALGLTIEFCMIPLSYYYISTLEEFGSMYDFFLSQPCFEISFLINIIVIVIGIILVRKEK